MPDLAEKIASALFDMPCRSNYSDEEYCEAREVIRRVIKANRRKPKPKECNGFHWLRCLNTGVVCVACEEDRLAESGEEPSPTLKRSIRARHRKLAELDRKHGTRKPYG